MTLDNFQVKKVARNVSFQWPGIIESDDLEQEIWLHILERPGTQRDLDGMDSLSRYRTLSKIAHRIASQQRTNEEYANGNFRYSVKEVKQLLENGALSESAVELQSAWSAEEFLPSGGSYEDPTFTQVSVRLDFDNALERMKNENIGYFNVLQQRYEGWEPVEDRSKLSRALSRLTTLMNHAHKGAHAERIDGPGSRKAISNSAARAISTSQYSGRGFTPYSESRGRGE